MRIVILAAGVGSRLGSNAPKPLTKLGDGRSILDRQVDNLSSVFDSSSVAIVVGFKKDLIMEALPEASFIYNPEFGDTNTSKSLLRALRLTGDEPVLWLNGDVVFAEELLQSLLPDIHNDRSFVCVNRAVVGDEEVKYLANSDGFVAQLSKSIPNAQGEAVGINYVSSADKKSLTRRLEEVNDDDYFERGIELAIDLDGATFLTIDVSSYLCIEVDFPEDLQRVNKALSDG